MLQIEEIDNEAASVSPEDNAISESLVGARLSTQPLTEYPGKLPGSLEQAYCIQSASIKRWPDQLVGWKLGRLQEADRERYSAERLAGPVFKSSTYRIETGESQSMPVYVGGFAAIEAEFVLELGTTVSPSDRKYSDDELVELVAAMYIGAEVASSPLADVNKLGPTCVTSDFGNNAGLIVGPEIPNWRTRSPESMEVSVSVDGSVVGSANASSIGGGPFHSLRFLVELFATRGITLPKGCFITTGATTGIHDVVVGSKSHLNFADLGHFDVEFEPRGPLA